MRFLIDTNVFIPLEGDDQAVDEAPFRLFQLAQQHGCTVVVHAASKRDLDRDRCTSRRLRNLAMLRKYSLLERSPDAPLDFRERVGSRLDHPHDEVDDALLFALESDCADFLVSEDLGVHAKASRVGLAPRVCDVSQAIQIVEDLYGRRVAPPPAVEDVEVYRILDRDPIWQSFSDDYPDFSTWLQRVKRQGRRAWACFDAARACEAVCIYKLEDSPLPEVTGKALKLCSFRVRPESWGRKLGELLLKAAFSYAQGNGCLSVYFTVFARKYVRLVVLAEDFGFVDVGKSSETREAVYVKRMQPGQDAERLDPLSYHVRYGPPAFTLSGCRTFVVPIQPLYHERLFPDAQAQGGLFTGKMSFGNTIKKAYICRASCRAISAGDLLLFYRSTDIRAVTTLGVVESTLRIKEADAIAAFVSKRTVYSMAEVGRLCGKEALALLFRQALHLCRPIQYEELLAGGYVRGRVQSVTQIRLPVDNLLGAHR